MDHLLLKLVYLVSAYLNSNSIQVDELCSIIAGSIIFFGSNLFCILIQNVNQTLVHTWLQLILWLKLILHFITKR